MLQHLHHRRTVSSLHLSMVLGPLGLLRAVFTVCRPQVHHIGEDMTHVSCIRSSPEIMVSGQKYAPRVPRVPGQPAPAHQRYFRIQIDTGNVHLQVKMELVSTSIDATLKVAKTMRDMYSNFEGVATRLEEFDRCEIQVLLPVIQHPVHYQGWPADGLSNHRQCPRTLTRVTQSTAARVVSKDG
jgi:hypothetical protein